MFPLRFKKRQFICLCLLIDSLLQWNFSNFEVLPQKPLQMQRWMQQMQKLMQQVHALADDLMTISYTLTLERRIKLDVHSSTQMNSIAFSSSTKHNNLQAFPLAFLVQLSSLVRTRGSGTADGSPEAKPDGSNLSTSHKSFLQNDKEF